MMEMQIRAWERQNLELAKQEWMPTFPLSILDLQGNSDIKKKPADSLPLKKTTHYHKTRQ
jgi:hypothetical protein